MKKQKYQYDLSKEMLKSFSENKSIDVTQAIDYLNSAAELLDESGFATESNNIINLLMKIAGTYDYTDVEGLKSFHEPNIKKHPKLYGAQTQIDPIKMIMDMGYTYEEALAIVNKEKNKEEEIELKSLLHDDKDTDIDELSPKDKILTFKSLAKAKELNKKKINDPHIKGLTSDKMTKNLKHHGTVFNMADDHKTHNDCSMDQDCNYAKKMMENSDQLMDDDITFED